MPSTQQVYELMALGTEVKRCTGYKCRITLCKCCRSLGRVTLESYAYMWRLG
jgi:hypothetical protein